MKPVSVLPWLAILALSGCSDASHRGASPPAGPPQIVSSVPAADATDVDPATTEVAVTFDRDMASGFSWTGGPPELPPSPAGQKAHWRDKRTCVLPVKLEAGRSYRVGVNSPSFRNFKSVQGVAVEPTEIRFTTKGAAGPALSPDGKPQIVQMAPANGAQDVDPKTKELRVTFNVVMAPGFSWTGGGEQFPPGAPGKQPYWTDGGKTCVLPVQLAPGKPYRLGINSPSHRNFRSAAGVPADPVVYTFKTRGS